jgi:uncharacterized delta-60 repeat protein
MFKQRSSTRPIALALAIAAFVALAGSAIQAHGSLDATFADHGRQMTDFHGLADAGEDVAVLPDKRFVVVGSASTSLDGDPDAGEDYAIARYRPDGRLDRSFSGNGKRTVSFNGASPQDESATAVQVQPNGKIVVAGFSFQGDPTAGGTGVDFAVARLLPGGRLDPRFGDHGKRVFDFDNHGGPDIAQGLALQPDGRIVIAGYSYFDTTERNQDVAVARLRRNGSFDRSFGGDGKQTSNFGWGSEEKPQDVAVTKSGKIVLAGSVTNFPGGDGSDFLVVRYRPNGRLDHSFSGDGVQATTFARPAFGSDDQGNGLALGSHGKIVVAGGTSTALYDFAVARYRRDGRLDRSFAGDGKQHTGFGSKRSDQTVGADYGHDVAIDAKGRILVTGEADATIPEADFGVVRYRPSGRLDRSFSGNGKARIDFRRADIGNAIALQGPGRILTVGTADYSAVRSQNFAIARYHSG